MKNEVRLVDANVLIEGRVCNDPIVIAVKYAPTVEPKRGKWEDTPNGKHCSVCGAYPAKNQIIGFINNFCFYCGADMREVDQ